MNGLHNVLEAACKAVSADASRFDDGVKPVLSNRTYVALVLWILERVTKLDDVATKRVAKLVPIAKRVVEGGKLTKEDRAILFDDESDADANTNPTLIARGLRLETGEAGINNVAGKGSRLAASAAARMLGAPFLDDLAKEIFRLDAVTTIAKQEMPIEGKVKACLWRGKTGAKVTHVIVLLDDGKTHGLIAKTKGQWRWQQGARDDILASIPDALMESAVSAVLGGASSSAATVATPAKAAVAVYSRADATADGPAAAIVRFPNVLCAVSIGPDGRMWAISTQGRLMEWLHRSYLREANDQVGRINGMHAGARGVVATWNGGTLTRWVERTPSALVELGSGDKIEGALVLDVEEGKESRAIAWWSGSDLHFTHRPKAKPSRLPEGARTISLDRSRQQIVAVSGEGLRRFDAKSGALVKELPLSGPKHAMSTDGELIATWKKAAAAKTIAISDAETGSLVSTLTVDEGHIDQVVFVRAAGGAATAHVLVRYQDGKRVMSFDLTAKGKSLTRLLARDLGSAGAAIEELFPLRCGSVLAFSPYPRGDTFLFDANARILRRWELERFYSGGRSFIADGGDRVLFGHARDSSKLLRFEPVEG